MNKDKIGKYYSQKAMAMMMGLMFATQEKKDVYLHESNIGPNQYEYSLRFRSEIVDPESSSILRFWKYTPSNEASVEVKPKVNRRPQRNAIAADTNLPAGASDHPGAPFNEDPDMVTCPACNGDSLKHDEEHCFMCESRGEITESEHAAMKAEEADEWQ